MVGKVAYANVVLEGPRAITARVRGTVPYTRAGIDLFRRGEPLGLHGWLPTAEPTRRH
jgi:hypothetical protein